MSFLRGYFPHWHETYCAPFLPWRAWGNAPSLTSAACYDPCQARHNGKNSHPDVPRLKLYDPRCLARCRFLSPTRLGHTLSPPRRIASETRVTRRIRHVGIRETLNKKPAVVTGVTIAVVVIALIAIFWQSRTPPVKGVTRAYYTSDDGQSVFEDDLNKPTPFTHDGAPAVQAHMFS